MSPALLISLIMVVVLAFTKVPTPVRIGLPIITFFLLTSLNLGSSDLNSFSNLSFPINVSYRNDNYQPEKISDVIIEKCVNKTIYGRARTFCDGISVGVKR